MSFRANGDRDPTTFPFLALRYDGKAQGATGAFKAFAMWGGLAFDPIGVPPQLPTSVFDLPEVREAACECVCVCIGLCVS